MSDNHLLMLEWMYLYPFYARDLGNGQYIFMTDHGYGVRYTHVKTEKDLIKLDTPVFIPHGRHYLKLSGNILEIIE